ncbi:hypothetical protein ACH4VX_19775 [Streptomyces sp. NPDC020731]|uniref:hypothetical protein n=1 Tax=Streptomyces sp. NPDC020731 TaxID=3365085 RepID=UPI0037AA28DB
MDEGKGRTPSPRFIVFSSAGIKADLETKLDKLGVAVVKPGKGQSGMHAEEVAARYKADVNFQKKDLGGKIVKVQNAFVTTQVCSVKCSKNLSKFLGVRETEKFHGTNGQVFGRTVDSTYLKEVRKAAGRGSAMNVVTKAMANGILPGQWSWTLRGKGGRR